MLVETEAIIHSRFITHTHIYIYSQPDEPENLKPVTSSLVKDYVQYLVESAQMIISEQEC